MLVALIATFASLLWLLHRATRLLQIPIPTLVRHLGIDIPAPPHVCLDAVTSDSVTLHWSLPDRASSVAKHVIQMNGQNVGESEKRETTVTITGLNPDQVYGVRVLAVNSNHYSAAGQLIRLRTRRKSENLVLASVQPVQPEESAVPTPKEGERRRSSTVQTQFRRASSRHERNNRSPNRRGERGGYTSSFTAATQPYTIESLAAELEQIRSDIVEVNAQYAHAEEEYEAASAALHEELDTLRDKRKEEDAIRTQMRSDNKALEETNRALQAQKTKVERAVKQKLEAIEKIKNDFAKWEANKVASEQRKREIQNLKSNFSESTKAREERSESVQRETHQHIIELEESIRGLVMKIKKAEMEKTPQYGKDNTPDNAFAKLLHSEDMEDIKLERSWREVQKSLELRYVHIFEQYREAEDKSRLANEVYGIVNTQGQQVAQPELSKSAKRRNRTRNKARAAVSSPIRSFPLHDPRFPDASTFNNLLFDSLQTTAFNGSSPSPSAITLDLHNNSSSSLALGGPYSMNSSLANLYPEPVDALSGDDLLSSSGGGTISPSADILLPSNLFMMDDLPQDIDDVRELDDEDIPRSRVLTMGSELSMDLPSTSFLPSLHNTPISGGAGFPGLSSAAVTPSVTAASAVQVQSQLQPAGAQYSPIGISNHSASSLLLSPPQYSFFPVGSSLKNSTSLPSPASLHAESASLLESLSATHSNSSNAGSSGDVILPPKLPPISSHLFTVLNSGSSGLGDDEDEDEDEDGAASLQQHSTNSSFSSNGFSFMKRSPSRRNMFGNMGTGISAIGTSIGNIGNIGRKKDSLDSPTQSATFASDETDEFLLLADGPRTPGRRFANLFSFSKRTGDVVGGVPAGAAAPAPSGQRSRFLLPQQSGPGQQQAPIGTRRKSGSFSSSLAESSAAAAFAVHEQNGILTTPTSAMPIPAGRADAPSAAAGSSPTPATHGSSNISGPMSTFGSQMGSLFGSPVFGRRGGRSLWDFNKADATNGSTGSGKDEW
ncbi:uncharacterized protein V1518DRAFT_421325 [Limtongia smithiae]|uniref:uncharacterized protein n=1 Tax=Limtongia smithiae TaxID=1125753 RepID=UPI0034CEF1BF